MLYKHNKRYIHHCWDDLRIRFKATKQVTQGKRTRLLCEWWEPPTALHFSLGKVTYWGVTSFYSQFLLLISQFQNLCIYHIYIQTYSKRSKREREECDLWCFKTCTNARSVCASKLNYQTQTPEHKYILAPILQTRNLWEPPQFCLATKALYL